MSDSEKIGILDRIMSEADDSAHPFLQKIQENIKIIVLTVGAALFVAAAYSLHSFWQDRKVSRANSEFEAIQIQDDPASRISELEEFLTRAPDRLKGAVLLEMAHAGIDIGDYQMAADSFEELAGFDPDMRPVGLLGKAKALELMEEYESAFRFLLNNQDLIPEEFRVQYLTLLSFNAEMSGDYQNALDAYQRLLDKAEGTDVGFIEYKIDSLRLKIKTE